MSLECYNVIQRTPVCVLTISIMILVFISNGIKGNSELEISYPDVQVGLVSMKQ